MMSETQKNNIEKLMNSKGVEFRGFEIAANKTKNGMVEGVPCVFNKSCVLLSESDYELRETVMPDAFEEADMTDVIFNYNHCGRVYARTRNKSLSLIIKQDGLHMTASLNTNDDGHMQLYNDISSGLIDRMSFAFTVKDEEYRNIGISGGKNIVERIIKKFDKIYDVSAVDISAYDDTRISARRAFDAAREKRNAVSVERVKDILNLKLKLEGIF